MNRGWFHTAWALSPTAEICTVKIIPEKLLNHLKQWEILSPLMENFNKTCFTFLYGDDNRHSSSKQLIPWWLPLLLEMALSFSQSVLLLLEWTWRNRHLLNLTLTHHLQPRVSESVVYFLNSNKLMQHLQWGNSALQMFGVYVSTFRNTAMVFHQLYIII